MEQEPGSFEASAGLVRRLQEGLSRRSGEPVARVETHISWVLLVGATAYKIKKPVGLPFLDFRDLERRRHFCEEELRINRRLSPPLYLGISRITGPADRPEIDGSGPTLEYAVRMRRFPPGSLLSEHAAAGDLRPSDVDRLAERVAALHRAASRAAPPSNGGSPERRGRVVQEALEGIAPLLRGARAGELEGLKEALRRGAEALAGLWRRRAVEGWIREGHGDLHLSNALLLDDEVLLFDAIEFDPALRWIDIVDDAAFAAMDLLAAGHARLAYRFLDRWLERVGDHEGLALWRYAMTYRALVRAHVVLIHELERPPAGPPASARYLQLARRLAAPPGPAGLLITHGLPGSGKSTVTDELLERCGAVRCRSDVERKRMFGLDASESTTRLGPQAAPYGEAATRRTYERLAQIARTALQSGWPVIVDAAFLRREEREHFAALARDLQRPFTILECRASTDVLRHRVAARQARAADPSEAGVDVLERLTGCAEPLDDAERSDCLTVDTTARWDGAALASRWQSRMEAGGRREPDAS